MNFKKPTDEATAEKITEETPTAEATPDAPGRPKMRGPSRTFILLVLCALLLFLGAFSALSLFTFAILPCPWNSGPPNVQLSIEAISLSPKKFAVVRVENLSGDTAWYAGYDQMPGCRVEYLADGKQIDWNLFNCPESEEKIPLRFGETFLFVVPVGWNGPGKMQPEAVRVGMAVYRRRSASTDDFDWIWSAPRRLQ